MRVGGVVALPFERLFGLAADALSPRAVERVADIKGRLSGEREGQPIAVILPDLESMSRVAVEPTPLARRLIEAHWPGPLTILVAARAGLPAPLVGPGGLIGVRLPGPSPAASLARETGLVLTATSANPPGGPDPLEHGDLADLPGVDIVVPGAVPGPPGSTVVDASHERPRVVRPGIIDIGTG